MRHAQRSRQHAVCYVPTKTIHSPTFAKLVIAANISTKVEAALKVGLCQWFGCRGRPCGWSRPYFPCTLSLLHLIWRPLFSSLVLLCSFALCPPVSVSQVVVWSHAGCITKIALYLVQLLKQECYIEYCTRITWSRVLLGTHLIM